MNNRILLLLPLFNHVRGPTMVLYLFHVHTYAEPVHLMSTKDYISVIGSSICFGIANIL